MSAPTPPCDLCQQTAATMNCNNCSLDLCFLCAYSRHFLGTLTQHRFQFLPFATPRCEREKDEL